MSTLKVNAMEPRTSGATIAVSATSGNITTLTSATSITINLSNSNPTSITAGQTGSIFITQDGTGSRTGSWGSYWDFIGGTAPTLTTTAAGVDRIDYVVLDSTNIQAVATLAYS